MSEPLDLNQLAQKLNSGAGTGLSAGRYYRYRSQRVRAQTASMAGQTIPRRNGLDGTSRYAARSPHELLPGTLRVISVRMNYLPANAAFASTLKTPNSAMLAVMRWAVTITNFCATDSKAGRDDSATLCFAEF